MCYWLKAWEFEFGSYQTIEDNSFSFKAEVCIFIEIFIYLLNVVTLLKNYHGDTECYFDSDSSFSRALKKLYFKIL